VLLRLAVRLNRSRSPRPLPRFTVAVKRSTLELEFPPGWLEAHPLTRADLDEEVLSLKGVDFEFAVR
jgi:exopolyphosphatase/guanosine-5'-triphosphate,3'-diphosphate pyrophosphatase